MDFVCMNNNSEDCMYYGHSYLVRVVHYVLCENKGTNTLMLIKKNIQEATTPSGGFQAGPE